MNNEIIVSASKVKRHRRIAKITTLILLILLLILTVFYMIFSVIYNRGNFTITLDKNLYYDRGIMIYDNPDYKVYRSELLAKAIEPFDNISFRWLPDDLDEHDGSHNGENYIAYTFYVENTGDEISDYWSNVVIDDVTKSIDDAIRIRIYKNGVSTTYAKYKNPLTDLYNLEGKMTAFNDGNYVISEHVERFGPGDLNKYTIVIWLEGNDPQCTNNILGGEIKLHMEFNSENVGK